jgi:SAM-dependent methyltransferase
VEIVSQTLPVSEPIYEFGSLQVEGQEGYADLRPFFPGKKYLGCDLREGPGVDLVLDLHQIDLPEKSAGAVLILDTLEHVEHLRNAVSELHRILKPHGLLIASSVMNFPIHEYPHDFWRFTPDGFKSLLKHFDHCWVGWAGEELFPHTVLGVASKSAIDKQAMDLFTRRMEDWKKNWFYPEGLSPEQILAIKERKRKKQKKLKNRVKRMLGKSG